MPSPTLNALKRTACILLFMRKTTLIGKAAPASGIPQSLPVPLVRMVLSPLAFERFPMPFHLNSQFSQLSHCQCAITNL
jgi:hypothetical protein